MTATDLIDRLASHKTFDGVPREELAWLAAHGSMRLLDEGEVLTAKGTPVKALYVVLAGRIAIFIDRGTGRHKLMEWHAGDVTGMLPYSRLVSPPADTVAQERTEIFEVPREDLAGMIRDCHQLTTLLVHKMLDRSKQFTSSALQDEKMLSLGKLSAGVAHELNNPVAAIERSAALLEDRLDEAEQATRVLGASRLSDAQLAALDGVRTSCLIRVPGVLSPIQQAEREDAITDWLTDHGVDAAVAGPLAETNVTLEALERVAAVIEGPALVAALRSVASGCSVRVIASEIQGAATRISGLVLAIKGFTHMDQATVAEPVDLAASLADTVTVLNAKARSKSAAITINLDPDLPRVRGFAGELNQIWANLIDNALDAIPTSGRVDVTAERDRHRIIVRVIDNGPGIPDEIRERVFDPFFTTKPVGKGTGLGLDIVQRLITHNEAEIDVRSVPGRTEFSVSLPLAESDAAEGRR